MKSWTSFKTKSQIWSGMCRRNARRSRRWSRPSESGREGERRKSELTRRMRKLRRKLICGSLLLLRRSTRNCTHSRTTRILPTTTSTTFQKSSKATRIRNRSAENISLLHYTYSKYYKTPNSPLPKKWSSVRSNSHAGKATKVQLSLSR